MCTQKFNDYLFLLGCVTFYQFNSIKYSFIHLDYFPSSKTSPNGMFSCTAASAFYDILVLQILSTSDAESDANFSSLLKNFLPDS